MLEDGLWGMSADGWIGCPEGEAVSGDDETVSMRGVPGLLGCNKVPG